MPASCLGKGYVQTVVIVEGESGRPCLGRKIWAGFHQDVEVSVHLILPGLARKAAVPAIRLSRVEFPHHRIDQRHREEGWLYPFVMGINPAFCNQMQRSAIRRHHRRPRKEKCIVADYRQAVKRLATVDFPRSCSLATAQQNA